MSNSMAIVLGRGNTATHGMYLPPLHGCACEKCGSRRLKLWRKSSTFSIHLICETCMTGGNVFSCDGLMMSRYGMTDQYLAPSGICYVPAIPDEEGTGYYWYTAAPKNGIRWWRGLPNSPTPRIEELS